MTKVSDLLGKRLRGIEQSTDELVFELDTGERCKLHHDQDCCESVFIEDIVGNLDDLLGQPLTMAEESTSREKQPSVRASQDDSFTWTFYRFATVKGYVTIRWCGESNGYYSESVDFAMCK